MDVRYTGMARQQIPHDIPMTMVILDDASECVVAEDQVTAEMIKWLSTVGTEISHHLYRLSAPLQFPWGRFELIPTDMPPDSLSDWTITQSGIYVPVPNAMTDEFRLTLARLATQSLRYFRPIQT